MMMQPPMFERAPDLKMFLGSVSPFHNNLSAANMETKGITYAAVSDKYQVHIVNYDSKGENINWEVIKVTDTNTDKPLIIIQSMLVRPSNRALPLLVVATTQGVQVFDVRTLRMIAQCPIETNQGEIFEPRDEWRSFSRGITCNDSLILVGTHTGEILQLNCTGDTSVSIKKPIQEHQHPIIDLATCKYDEVTCSSDSSGEIVVWHKPMKSVHHKIIVKEPATCMNVLRKQVIVGTTAGSILFYSLLSGELMAQVHGHSRPVTSVAVAPESAYVMSSGEDGRFVVYKLHTRKPNAYQVEYRFSDELSNSSISGAQFTNGRGSNIAITCYDRHAILMYRIIKKTAA